MNASKIHDLKEYGYRLMQAIEAGRVQDIRDYCDLIHEAVEDE